MADIKWIELCTTDVPAKPNGLWTKIVEYIPEDTLIKIEADKDGVWSYTQRTTDGCSADGDLTSHISSANCLVTAAPPGCLVGKIGGSTADEGTDTFACGTFVVHLVAKEKAGPLYLTINDEKAGFEDNEGGIEVSVFSAAKT